MEYAVVVSVHLSACPSQNGNGTKTAICRIMQTVPYDRRGTSFLIPEI